MIPKSGKLFYILLLIGCVLVGYCLWLSLRPVEIVAVHNEGDHSSVLVKNFPITDHGRINWWTEHQNQLKIKYNVPQPDKDGDFTIVFWLFGDGYKEEGKYDRRCFSDMQPPVNCIEKDKVFTIAKGRNGGVSFLTNDKLYRMKKNGDLVKEKFS